MNYRRIFVALYRVCWTLPVRFTVSVFLSVLVISLNGANRYWIGSGGNWNSTANWSTASSGPGPASVPIASDDVFFDGSSGNCVINANAVVNNISLSSAFTGTISQSAGITFSISGNSTWAGGRFSGGNSTITNAGTFSLTGSSFSSTSGTLVVRGNFSFSSGSFAHNNGTVDFQTNNLSLSGSPTFNNLKNTPSYNTYAVSNSFSVAGNFTLNGTGAFAIINTPTNVVISVAGNLYKTGNDYVQFNGGLIDVKGDVIVTNSATANGGTGTISISGTGAQQLSSSVAAYSGRLPSILINKPSGTLSLTGSITVGGPSWTYSAGTINAGSSMLYFYNEPGSGYISISGTHSLNNVYVYPYYSTNPVAGNLTVNNFTLDGVTSSDMAIGSTLTVNGNLYMTGTDHIDISGGLLDLKGDLIITNTNANAAGNGTVQFSGTGNQQLSGSGSLGSGKLPNVVINKPSGTLSLVGNISCTGPNWSYVSGTLNAGTSALYLYRIPGGSDIKVSGTQTLNNVSLTSYYSAATFSNNLTVNNFSVDAATPNAVAISSVITVNGNFITSGGEVLTFNTGTINAKGNITCSNTNAGSGGNTAFIINGASSQSLTGTGTANQSHLPSNVILSKSSGSLIISGGVPFYFYNTLNFNQGVIVSTATQLAVFASGSSVTGTPGNTSYIDGPVKKIGNTAFTFPVGKNNLYAPIGISSPTNATHAFTAEYFDADPDGSYAAAMKDASLNHLSSCEYWILNRTAGTSNASVTLSWNTRSCGVTNLGELRVARWDGSQWRDQGNSVTTGNTTAGTVTSTLVTSFSPFTLASSTINNPLPVELSGFKGACANNNVQLQWKTLTEIDDDHFELERSVNGTQWSMIQKIKGNGTSSTEKNYSVIDGKPLQGINYYRLKQVDSDGRYKYFPAIEVDVCSGAESPFLVYPNPAASVIHIVTGIGGSDIQIAIRDNLGRILYSRSHNGGTIELDLRGFENGTYFLTVTAPDLSKSAVINLLKD